MNNFDYEEPAVKDLLKKNSHLRIMVDFLDNKPNPKVLELGVERGTSTRAFLWYLKKIWNYNPIIKIFYPYLRKTKKILSFK